METIELGVIGGSGLYELAGLVNQQEVELPTPYGNPSDPVMVGELAGRRVAFLARHGRGHRISPSEVPAAANIYALKSLGVTEIVSVSAVGSLREELRPGDFVVPDQLVDRTSGIRRYSFFGNDVVAHVQFADPYCARLRGALLDVAGADTDTRVHAGGTYVCIEGPQFSTRAESTLYRSWGMDVIGMTASPEAKLAREAGICLANLALVTDYDCWREATEEVTADMVAAVMAKNVATAKAVIETFAQRVAPVPSCACRTALANAVLSDPASIPAEARERLRPLLA
jgi:5'-methylthioadenosine phosphorylase